MWIFSAPETKKITRIQLVSSITIFQHTDAIAHTSNLVRRGLVDPNNMDLTKDA